jgi:hypothetical protein
MWWVLVTDTVLSEALWVIGLTESTEGQSFSWKKTS